MHVALDAFPQIAKVGCALKIDDLPDCFSQKQTVIDWELGFWRDKRSDPRIGTFYNADVATTFAMFRSVEAVNTIGDGPAIRLAPPLDAVHLSWYLDPNDLPADEAWYYDNAPQRRWGVPEPGISWRP